MTPSQIFWGIIMLTCMTSMIIAYYNESRLLRRKHVMTMYITLAIIEAILAVLSFAGVFK